MTGKHTKPSLQVEPPDGGWGWVVAVSSNMALTIALLVRCVGVFFNEWMDYFDASATAVGMVGSIHMASFLFMGPVGGFLCRKIGHRNLAVLSGAMTFISLLIASRAKTLIHLILAFGALGGISMGFVFVSASTVIGLYFKKRFATANSISNSGNGIAIMVLPIIARLLIDSYSWNGALFIFAAITANICVCGMLFRPVHQAKKKQYSAVGYEDHTDHMDPDLKKVSICEKQIEDELLQTSSGQTELPSDGEPQRKLSKGSWSLEEKGQQSLKPLNNKHDRISVTSSHPDEKDTGSGSIESLSSDKPYKETLNLQESVKVAVPSEDQKGISKSDAKSIVLAQTAAEADNLNLNVRQRRPTKASLYLGHFVRDSGLHLLKTKYRFSIFCLSQILQAMCFTSVFLYIVPLAIAKDVSKLNAALLLSVTGLGSLVGRLITGPIVDCKIITVLKLYFIIYWTCGVSVAACPAIKNYAGYVVITAVFGLSSGMYKSLQLLLIKMFIGSSGHLSTAWGAYMPFLGIGNLIAPVFVGWLHDKRGDYDLPFYITGSLFALASFHILLMPYLSKLEKKHHPENEMANLPQVAMTTPDDTVAMTTVAEMRNSMSLTAI